MHLTLNEHDDDDDDDENLLNIKLVFLIFCTTFV